MWPEFLALKHESRILGHSTNSVCGFSMMAQVRLCAVWPMENWLGSSLEQIQGWTTVRESYSRALEPGPLTANVRLRGRWTRLLPSFPLSILFGHSTVHCNRMPSSVRPAIQIQIRHRCCVHSLKTLFGIPQVAKGHFTACTGWSK